MFNWIKKIGETRPDEDYEDIVLHEYSGQVISSEYNVNDPDESPYHLLCPHGRGTIKYIYNGEAVEQYEGDFDGGQYSGNGKLVKDGKIFEGQFKNNKFVE